MRRANKRNIGQSPFASLPTIAARPRWSDAVRRGNQAEGASNRDRAAPDRDRGRLPPGPPVPTLARRPGRGRLTRLGRHPSAKARPGCRPSICFCAARLRLALDFQFAELLGPVPDDCRGYRGRTPPGGVPAKSGKLPVAPAPVPAALTQAEAAAWPGRSPPRRPRTHTAPTGSLGQLGPKRAAQPRSPLVRLRLARDLELIAGLRRGSRTAAASRRWRSKTGSGCHRLRILTHLKALPSRGLPKITQPADFGFAPRFEKFDLCFEVLCAGSASARLFQDSLQDAQMPPCVAEFLFQLGFVGRRRNVRRGHRF